MAAKTAKELAAQDPRLKAMLMELGSARLDDLPMEDGEGGKRGRDFRVYSHPSTLSGGTQGVVPKVPIKSAWAKAIQRGDFDDDDAAQVSGMDPMADGQLARARRNRMAANTAFNYTNDNYEGNIRRDRNGYVPPRATVSNHGKRPVPGPVPVGNGPIDIDRTLTGTNAGRRPRTALSGPMNMDRRNAVAGGFASQPSARAHPAPMKPQIPNVQGTQSTAQSQVRLVLPDGASIVLQLPASLAAAVFPKKSQRYSGKAYLISGSRPSEDMMILAVEDKKALEIRHLISEYDTYMSVSSTGLMLKFTSSESGFSFYGVDFENGASMNSFIHALRKLLERPRQEPQDTSATSNVEYMSTSSGTGPTAAKVEPPQSRTLFSTTIEPETAAPAPKQQERKDVIAQRLAELKAQKQAEDVSVSKQSMIAPEPIEDVPVSAELAPNQTPGTRGRTFSPSVGAAVVNPIACPGTASLALTSKPDELKSGAASANNAIPSVAVNAEAQRAQAIHALEQQTSASARVSPDVTKQIMPQPDQAARSPIQQTETMYGVGRKVIEEIIQWAWDTARYMQHSVPEQFGFDTIRTVIGASSAAVIGRTSPSFRQLSPAVQQDFIQKKVAPHVETGFLKKLALDEPLAAEFEDTEVGRVGASPQGPKMQDQAGSRAVAPSKLSGPVYEMEELLSMRSAAAAIDPGMLPKIPRVSTKAGVPQPKPGLSRVPVEEQVQQAAAENSNWLYVTSSLHKNGILLTRQQKEYPDDPGRDGRPNQPSPNFAGHASSGVSRQCICERHQQLIRCQP